MRFDLFEQLYEYRSQKDVVRNRAQAKQIWTFEVVEQNNLKTFFPSQNPIEYFNRFILEGFPMKTVRPKYNDAYKLYQKPTDSFKLHIQLI